MFRAITALRACAAPVLIAFASLSLAQTSDPDNGLVGTWMLVALERHGDGGEAARVRAPRGVLIIDSAGHAFEFFHAPLLEAESQMSNPQRTLEEFGGFWGRYEVDEAGGRLSFAVEDGVSPSVRGLEFARGYELDGDRLIVTSSEEPQAQDRMRWMWQRLPTVENLSPAYRQVVGFWRHIEERQVDTATGEVQRSSQRGPSVIVYTPAGFVGVHFPPVGRVPFPDATPTAEEAQVAMRGYIGYFGSLGVYPGEVSHNVLAGVSPTGGSILRRYADITGDELVVRLQSSGFTSGDGGPRTVTEVVLRRLSDADDMLP